LIQAEIAKTIHTSRLNYELDYFHNNSCRLSAFDILTSNFGSKRIIGNLAIDELNLKLACVINTSTALRKLHLVGHHDG